MKQFLCGLALVALASNAGAVPGTASIPVKFQDGRRLGRRADGVKSVAVINNQDDIFNRFYSVEVQAGTPPQKMSLVLNTMSSDTFFSDFNPEKSTTFVNGSFGSTVFITGDPTTIPPSDERFHLDYYEDAVTIAGLPIPNQRFGIATDGPGIGGLSLGPNLQLGYKAGKPFNSVLDNLAAQNVISSRTYSVDLRDYDNPEGVLLFGGADTGRFSGELVRRPLVKDELGTWGPSIVLTGTGQTGVNGSKYTYDVNATDSVFTLDSVNQCLRLRHSFVDPLLRDLGAINDGNDQYTAPCSLRDGPGSWDLQFGDATVKIPYKSLILDAVLEEGSDYCIVGILVTWRGQLVLGAPFFQSAYISYDFDNQQVGLAQPANCDGEVVAFGSGADAVDKLTGCETKSHGPTSVGNDRPSASSTDRDNGAEATKTNKLASSTKSPCKGL